MQSFHQSRGKILFEVFCALAVSASCVGAWMQTGAWAMLAVASVVALYGFSHALDLRARRPAAVDSADAGAAISNEGILSDEHGGAPLTPTDRQSTTGETIENAGPVEPAKSSPATKASRAKTGPKNGGRRTKGGKVTRVTELAPPVEADVDTPVAVAEEAQFPLVPLFEPQPFMRQQRAVFGRKDNLA